MQISRSTLLCVLVMACLGLRAGGAGASSAQERTIAAAPAPHEIYSTGGVMVKVHRARLDGHTGTEASNAAAIASLRTQVEKCMASNEPKSALKPTTEWPVYSYTSRIDEYVSANRSIRYSMVVTYLMHPANCGLMSEISSVAHLSSTKGLCIIDLVKKVAEGPCDRNGHADAPIRPRQPSDLDGLIKRMEANPATAAAAAQMKIVRDAAPKKTGEQHIVKGARCNVWRQTSPTGGATKTFCFATGGTFIASNALEDGGPGGLAIEHDDPDGFRYKTVDVKMDTEVSSALFTPYNAAGFTIERDGQ
nr:hypothetical protein [uncultured Duganella sp.]